MMPNLRHLHVFREVAKRKSVSAASQAVHLSQPAITQAVASLEKQFGTALFDRSNAGMRLTEAGEVCLRRVERAIGQIHDGVAEITRTVQRGGRSQGPDPERSLTSSQLRALIAIVEHGNFSLAARARGVSQPTIHRAARESERIVGVSLFERTSFGVTPTREAEKLARRARLAFAEIRQARVEIDALRGGERGSTVIGAMPLARSHLVPRALIDFTVEYPGHRVSIQEGLYEDLLAALRNGEVDFLIGAMREQVPFEDAVQEHLFDDPLAIIMRAGHPFAHKKKVTVRELAMFPWVAPRAGSPLHRHFDDLFASAGIEPPLRAIECNSLIAARALLLESDRVMLLSAYQIHYELQAGLLVALPHPGGSITRPIGLTVRHDWHPTAAQQRLLQLLRQHASAYEMPLTGRDRPVRQSAGERV